MVSTCVFWNKVLNMMVINTQYFIFTLINNFLIISSKFGDGQ